MAIRLDTELLRRRTIQLLGEVGLKIEHEELEQLMLARGCTISPSGRVRIPNRFIADLGRLPETTVA